MHNAVDFEILISYRYHQMEPLYHPKLRFPFSLEKGTAMLQYLLRAVGGEYNYMGLLKLAFFADRYHARFNPCSSAASFDGWKEACVARNR